MTSGFGAGAGAAFGSGTTLGADAAFGTTAGLGEAARLGAETAFVPGAAFGFSAVFGAAPALALGLVSAFATGLPDPDFAVSFAAGLRTGFALDTAFVFGTALDFAAGAVAAFAFGARDGAALGLAAALGFATDFDVGLLLDLATLLLAPAAFDFTVFFGAFFPLVLPVLLLAIYQVSLTVVEQMVHSSDRPGT